MNDLCVIGLGYVGLPTASLFARAGLTVLGVDVHPGIVGAVNEGRSPIEEPGLPDLVKQVVGAGKLRAAQAPEPSSAFLIAVGTPIDQDNRPDLANLRAATSAIGAVLRRGDLVVVESTVPPGTTTGDVATILQSESGLRPGVDFRLVHCAERAIPGLALKEMVENDRLVGGLTPACARRGAQLYRRMVEGDVVEEDALTSEIVKLAENTFRDVNIAFANEMARLCEKVGADVWRVIRHANRHPRVNIHAPGPGVGGHCIPVVPWFLMAAAEKETTLMRTARLVNADQSSRLARAITGLLPDDAQPPRVALLGVAYKSGTDDARNSPAAPLIGHLENARVEVRSTDPHVKRFSAPLLPLDESLEGADVVVIMNDEPAYRALDPRQVAAKVRSRVLVDTRNIVDADAWRAAGFTVMTLGVGASAQR